MDIVLNVPFSDRQGALSDSKGAPSRTLGRSKKSKKYPLGVATKVTKQNNILPHKLIEQKFLHITY